MPKATIPSSEDRITRALDAMSPPGMVILAIVSIQVGAALAVKLFPVLGPVGTVFFRVAISAIFLLGIIRPSFNAAVWKHRKLLLTYGVALGAMNWCFYEAIARIPLGIAVAIEFMGPLAVAVVTSRRAVDLLWVAIAAAGLLALTPDFGSELDSAGVVLAGMAGVGWAGFIVLSQRVNKVLPGNSGLAYGMVIASVAILPFAAGDVVPVLSDMWLFANVAAVAIFATAIPFYLEFAALRRLTAQTYGVLVTMEPAVAAGVGAVMLGEVLSLQAMAAIVCVTAAAIGATKTREK